jgi:hypothetical protein
MVLRFMLLYLGWPKMDQGESFDYHRRPKQIRAEIDTKLPKGDSQTEPQPPSPPQI